jgi:5-methylcytosine-specific restriction endonuclease McrA
VLGIPVLVLNRHFAPVTLATARRALVLLYGGAARALDDKGETHDFDTWLRLPVRERDDVVPLINTQLRVPRVLHLVRYDRFPVMAIRLTRRNLLLRDDSRCQYCARRPPLRELNIDHVIPRSRGGRDTWENLVISCRDCNLKKGRRTPAESGMQLLRRPVKPRWTTSHHILLASKRPYEEWTPFLKAG